jgi:hypothetical protein
VSLEELIAERGGAIVDASSLVGLHTLDARAEFNFPKPELSYWDSDPAVAAYRIDGEWFAFIEDPSDGYRSTMGGVAKLPAAAIPRINSAAFAPILLEFRWFDGARVNSYGLDRLLYATSENSDGCVLVVGTRNYDDYYPTFLHSWAPDGSLIVPSIAAGEGDA